LPAVCATVDRAAMSDTAITLPASIPSSHTASVDATFRAQVRRTPDAAALRTRDTTVSYAELDRRSDAFAAHLKATGVKPGMKVAMLLPRSIDAIIAMLGTLKARAAFVPFDSDYPQAALAAMSEDCNPAVMVANVVPPFWRGPTLVPAMLAGANPPQSIEAVNDLASDDLASDDPASVSNSLASVMYTSGSTGRPKGVMVPHRAIMRLVIDADFATFSPDEIILQLAPLGFDASTFEIWGALLNGGTLAIETASMPSLDDIARSIRMFGVTTLWLTAGLFHLMVDQRPDALRGLRQLLAGGDVLSPTHVLHQLRNAPGCRLINGYGPTENTTFTCCYTIPADWDGAGPVPIGMPINGTEVFILDEWLHPVPEGEPGELCAAGDGLALGYLNQPEVTAQRFVESPFGPLGTRLYRTGDLVHRRADGAINFLGRLDRQVKINGKRIELEAVEAALRAVSDHVEEYPE
jgi:amino acid adenylation domain-containing protein